MKRNLLPCHTTLLLILIAHIGVSNTYFHGDMIHDEEVPHYTEFSRDRNPLHISPRVWSCQKGKCVKRIIERNNNNNRQNSSEYNMDNRLV